LLPPLKIYIFIAVLLVLAIFAIRRMSNPMALTFHIINIVLNIVVSLAHRIILWLGPQAKKTYLKCANRLSDESSQPRRLSLFRHDIKINIEEGNCDRLGFNDRYR
jgi:disulfide bond formation protein DsbB